MRRAVDVGILIVRGGKEREKKVWLGRGSFF